MSNIKISYLFGVALLIVFFIFMYSSDSLNLHTLEHVKNLITRRSIEISDHNLEQNEEHFIKLLQEKYLILPSQKPYNLLNPSANPSMGQGQIIDKILNEMKNGFYIECGALDGETRSNSLFFEKERDWNGLLIEADPKNVAKLLKKNRKALVSNTCMAPSEYPQVVRFEQHANTGHIAGVVLKGAQNKQIPESEVEVQCFPLAYYLKALDVHTVDYFSLDVEGAEFGILKTIPFDEFDIKTLSVEFIHGEGTKAEIKEFMEGKGYVTHSEVTHKNWWANDFIFVKKEIFDKISS